MMKLLTEAGLRTKLAALALAVILLAVSITGVTSIKQSNRLIVSRALVPLLVSIIYVSPGPW